MRQPLAEREVELDRCIDVQRRDRLVQEQDVGLVQQDAGEDQPLLLPAGEHVAPVVALVELGIDRGDERAEPDARQHVGDGDVAEGAARLGIGDELLQRHAVGHVRVLPGEERPRPLAERDPARAIGPEPGDRLEERALAAAVLAPQVDPVARHRPKHRHRQERGGVLSAMVQRELVEQHRGSARQRRPLEAADAGLGIEAFAHPHPLDGGGKLGEAPGVGPQRRDGRHHVYEPRHVGDQRRRQLGARHEIAECHAAGHVGRQRRKIGEQSRRQEIVDVVEHHHPGAPDVLAMPGAVDCAIETAVDVPLRALATRNRELADPVEHRCELATPGPVAALTRELLALQNTSQKPGDKRHGRHVEQDQPARKDRRSVLSWRQINRPRQSERVGQRHGELVERLDGAAPPEQLLRDEEDRGHGTPEPHRQTDQATVEPCRTDVDALVDRVRHACAGTAVGTVAHQVEGDALVGQDLGVEAIDQPGACATVQRRRHEMPERCAGGPGDEDAEIEERGQQQRARRVGRIAVVEFGKRGDEIGTGRRGPDAGLAEHCRHGEDDGRQRPRLLPPVRGPVRRGQAPEGAKLRRSLPFFHHTP